VPLVGAGARKIIAGICRQDLA